MAATNSHFTDETRSVQMSVLNDVGVVVISCIVGIVLVLIVFHLVRFFLILVYLI